MSKRHRLKQVAKVQQLLNGERNSLTIIAYPSEVNYLERKFAVKIYCHEPICKVPGLYRFEVKKV